MSSSPSNSITSGRRWSGAASNESVGCIVGRTGSRIRFNILRITECCSLLFQPDTCRRRKIFFGRAACSSVQFCHERWRLAKNSTCGSRACTSGSLHMIATWVKKHRQAERFASCFGIFLIRFPLSRMTMLPRVWVYSNGTAVSSRFNNNGTFPAVLAFWHNHWHHFHVKVAWTGGLGFGVCCKYRAYPLPFRCDLGPAIHVRLCWARGRFPGEARWKATGSSAETTGTRRIVLHSWGKHAKEELQERPC